jgi:Zn-dependent M28 family amino/carboxypeptidase
VLVQERFDAARATGQRDYFSARGMVMVDDHVPFLGAGIPAIDIIDFEYGSAPGLNDYWHTERDTLDKLSPHSLEVVGQSTLQLLNQLRKSPSLR